MTGFRFLGPVGPVAPVSLKSITLLPRRSTVDSQHLDRLVCHWPLNEGDRARGAADLIDRHFAGVHDLRAAGRVGAEDLADPVLTELRLGHLAHVAHDRVTLARDRRANEQRDARAGRPEFAVAEQDATKLRN